MNIVGELFKSDVCIHRYIPINIVGEVLKSDVCIHRSINIIGECF